MKIKFLSKKFVQQQLLYYFVLKNLKKGKNDYNTSKFT